jgi:hypothetical protein
MIGKPLKTVEPLLARLATNPLYQSLLSLSRLNQRHTTMGRVSLSRGDPERHVSSRSFVHLGVWW